MKKLIIIFSILFPVSTFAFSAPLEVKERAGTARVNAPVSYGVPIAESEDLKTISGLGITGKDAQFRVLSRYNGTINDTTKPIRMVLVDFQDSLAAGGTNTRYFTNSGVGTANSANLASDKSSYIEIITGKTTVQISKTSGNIFESVSVEGEILVSSPSDDKFTVVYNNKTYYSSPISVIIEENGPLRSVVKAEGVFKDLGGALLIPPVTRIGETPDSPIRYTIRYFAYKDKSYIKLQTTLRNENFGWAYRETQAAHNIDITEAYLKTSMNGLNSTKTVAFDNYSDNTNSDTYELFQDEVSDGETPSYDWAYNIKKNNVSVSTGEKFDSFVDLRDSSKGLMVADRWFWQNFPIGISITGNELKFNLWPDTGMDHRILGSIWKTHELLYYFHGSDTSFDDELAHIKKRLIAKASDEHYAETNFAWGMVPENIVVDYTFPAGEKFQDVLDGLSATHRANFDEDYSTSSHHPNTVLSLREGRKVKLTNNPSLYPLTPDIYGSGYGWLEFGAMTRAAEFGYHNQHYDWGFLAYSGFLRFNDYAMFDVAEELLMHKSDILTMHDPDEVSGGAGYEYHGAQRYELDALFSYYYDYSVSGNAGPRKTSHFWTKDLSLQYLLTGEYRYYEVIKSAFDHVDRVKDSPTMLTSETRNQYRGIDALCNGYQITGETKYLDDALSILNNNYLVAEGGDCTKRTDFRTCTSDGVSGYIIGGLTDKYDFGPGGNAWSAEPLIKLYYTLVDAGRITEAAELKTFMIRWAKYIRDNVFTARPDQGTYRNNYTEYNPYIAYYSFIDGVGYDPNYMNNLNRVYLQPYTELFSFMFIEADSDNQEWLNLARVLQKDALFYSANKDEFLPVQNDISSAIQGIVIDASLASGAFKIPKSITKAAFHLRVEAGLEEAPAIRANVNQQGGINVGDALLVFRKSLGLSMTGTAWKNSNTTGDVNCDGIVNLGDALLLLKYSIGLNINGDGWCE